MSLQSLTLDQLVSLLICTAQYSVVIEFLMKLTVSATRKKQMTGRAKSLVYNITKIKGSHLPHDDTLFP